MKIGTKNYTVEMNITKEHVNSAVVERTCVHVSQE